MTFVVLISTLDMVRKEGGKCLTTTVSPLLLSSREPRAGDVSKETDSYRDQYTRNPSLFNLSSYTPCIWAFKGLQDRHYYAVYEDRGIEPQERLSGL